MNSEAFYYLKFDFEPSATHISVPVAECFSFLTVYTASVVYKRKVKSNQKITWFCLNPVFLTYVGEFRVIKLIGSIPNKNTGKVL